MTVAPSVAHQRKRVLLVEDDTLAGDAIAWSLEGRYNVSVARDGVEGAEMAAACAPDLIVTDVMMPRLDGVSMVQRIRRESGSKAPIIFMTGGGSTTDVIAGIVAGARHYLKKPVDMNDLARKIHRILDP